MEIETETHWPEALVTLIDALESFIRIDAAWGNRLLADGSITRADHARGVSEIAAMRRLLKKLKELEPDRTLDGTIPLR